MKKNLIILMILLVLITGCGKKKDNVDNNKKEPTTELKTESTTTESTTTSTTTTTTSQATSKTTTTKKVTTKKTTKKPTTKKPTTKKSTTAAPAVNTPAPATTTKQLTEAEVYNAMIALKSQYPTGTPWNNSNKYSWKGGIYSAGYGCAGFAFMLSDAAFGSRKARKHTDFNNIKVGDIVRYLNDSHSVIVLAVSGDTFTVAEGNMNEAVYWGRQISRSEFKSTGTYVMTRW